MSPSNRKTDNATQVVSDPTAQWQGKVNILLATLLIASVSYWMDRVTTGQDAILQSLSTVLTEQAVASASRAGLKEAGDGLEAKVTSLDVKVTRLQIDVSRIQGGGRHPIPKVEHQPARYALPNTDQIREGTR